MQKQPGIYFEVKPAESSDGMKVPFDKLHAYLLLRRPDGTTEVIRGGPMWSLNIQTLVVETGKSLEESEDKYDSLEIPDSRPSVLLDLGSRDPEKVWRSMRQAAEKVGKGKHSYLFDTDDEDPDQTSNSVVASALAAGGISVDKVLPPGVTKNDLPG